MTAEVALLNKTAVALAADSAMTVGGSGKTYPTPKLFALTKHHPVGMMVYNNAEFMGIPWETLIKMYRRALGTESRPTVEAYVDDFLGFIASEPFTTPEQESANLLHIAHGLFVEVERSVRKGASIRAAVRDFRSMFQAIGRSASMTRSSLKGLLSGWEAELDELIDEVFGDPAPTAQAKQSLRRLVGELIVSEAVTPNHSGIVLAGFGEDEFFPTLIAVKVDGVVGGTLRQEQRLHVDIARGANHGMVVPFAQGEMVTRFMEGIDPMYQEYLGSTMAEASKQVVMEVLKAFDVNAADLETTVSQAVHEQTSHYLQETAEFRHREFVTPIMEIVEHLPKEELADMGEALVNLTALKRRVSTDEETVGGPVDVAVISKGDGFVWIRRNDYFDAALNRNYGGSQD